MRLKIIVGSVLVALWLGFIVWFLAANKQDLGPLSVVSRDGVELGQIFEIDLADDSQDNARIIELVRSFLIKSLDGKSSTDGMAVQLTIDSELQQKASQLADQTVAAESEPTAIGMVVLDNSTGGILAMIGGRDFGDEDLVFERRFRVGSMAIPFVYSAGVDRAGLLPQLKLSSGDKEASVQDALVSLDSDLALVAGTQVGESSIKGLLQKLYFDVAPKDNITRAVEGDFDCTLMTLTSAYSTLGAKGANFSPYLISKVDNSKRALLFSNKERSVSVFESSVPVTIAAMLKPEKNLHLVSSDNWCVGFTNKITIGIYAVNETEFSSEKLKTICRKLEAVAAQRDWSSSAFK